ncbi:putative lipid II flippase FtsW [Paenibacillus alvei]|uniref:Probable peptidoglycan glycosyltransferase FtsW n=1 Tax=Paenibacillus alvei TaxID=44250 RepID=A0A383RAT1_PAEAL|nr:putative lipid II flippase FtsW [Paenibacillus alvei]SYX83692.1 Stage V sporulation protein E [Paenibacillus alvei]
MEPTITRGRPDFLLLLSVVLLACFGMAMIFSASSALSSLKHEDPWYYTSRQVKFACIGLLGMFVMMNIPIQVWKKTAPYLLLLSVVLLIVVMAAGSSMNGARRWIVVGGFQFQPVEFTKLALIMYISSLISNKGERIRSFKKGLLPILIVVSFISLLIMKQPDFGAVIMLLFICLTVMIVGGVHMRQLAVLFLAALPVIIYLAFSQSYRLQRIASFMNPYDDQQGSGYQLIQSIYALAHGGVTGTGFGHGIQKLFYLPEAHTDFIFAVIGEEFGFLGSCLVVFVFFVLVVRGFMAALNSDDPFAIMLGTGIVSMIFIQFMLNLGAVTGLLPITGVPLPFVSYGGSSLILCMASTGIILSISRDNYRRQQLQGSGRKGIHKE